DIGGTSVKYGIWKDEVLGHKGSFRTPATWAEMKTKLLTLKNRLGENTKISGVAISSPGAVNQNKGIIEGSSAVLYLHHFPILTELTDLFQCPVSIENDANCAALAEIWKGAAKGLKNVLFVVVGTGIGGAVIIDGKVWHGKHLFGGEFGYMLLKDNATFSELGTAVNMAKRVAKRKNISEDELSGEAVFQMAENGDLVAQEEVEAFYHYLAQGIYNLQYSFDPEKIIIGGGVSNKADLLPQLRKRMEKIIKQVEIAPFIPEIALCEFKNDANLIGAIYNWGARHHSWTNE
ncbi:MAG: ROK family protein, partial [Heyndrickxia sp.]